MEVKKRIFLFVLVPIIIFLIASFIFFLNRNRKKTELSKNLNIPTTEVLPTIDSSVIIDLKPIKQKKGVVLEIKNIPLKTKSIEYIITYETKDGGFQGVNSNAFINGSKFEKEIELRTCSAGGACVDHQVKRGIKLELVFKGDYGVRFFNKEYFL